MRVLSRGFRLAIPAVGLMLLLLSRTVSAEAIRVSNTAGPAGGTRTLELEQLWTLGAEDGDLFFGVVNRVLIDQQQNVYLLDSQLSEVKVLSPQGELIATLGREGDGPGEFRGPTEMAFLPDGTLGVLQAFPGKIIRLNRSDGTPAGSWPLSDADTGGFLQIEGMRVAGGEVLVSGVHQIMDQAAGTLNRDNILCYMDVDTGLLGREIMRRVIAIDLQNLRLEELQLAGGFEGRFDLLPDGRAVVAGSRNRYEISIFTPDGELERVFSRPFTSWKRDDYANDIWKHILEQVERTQAPGSPISWEDTEADVQSLFVTAEGTIWIQTSRGRWAPPRDVFTTFDVFSDTGEYLEEIHFICEGDPRLDMLFFSGRDRVFRIGQFWDAALARFGGAAAEEDEDEPQPVTVTCYRIKS